MREDTKGGLRVVLKVPRTGAKVFCEGELFGPVHGGRKEAEWPVLEGGVQNP